MLEPSTVCSMLFDMHFGTELMEKMAYRLKRLPFLSSFLQMDGNKQCTGTQHFYISQVNIYIYATYVNRCFVSVVFAQLAHRCIFHPTMTSVIARMNLCLALGFHFSHSRCICCKYFGRRKKDSV